MSSLTTILIALIVVGAVVYVANLLPIDATFKRIIQVVAIIALVIWLLRAFMPAAGLG